MNLNEIKSRAKAGDAEALYELAVAYRTGDGVPLSIHKSVSLLTDSADRKYLPAMYDLAKYGSSVKCVDAYREGHIVLA
jgi:TPR repeat protein